MPNSLRYCGPDEGGAIPRPGRVRQLFRELDGAARPHHTFYVMSTFVAPNAVDGPNLANESGKKIAAAMDSCRVSWGTVLGVGGD